MSDMILAMRLMLDSQRWASGLNRAQGGMKGFVSRTRSELRSLRGEFSGITGQLAALGLGFSATTALIDSARRDKGLTQIRQTAAMTRGEVSKLRQEIFRMGAETGANTDSLQAGFGQLVAGGLGFSKALPTLEAINSTIAVTGSEATTLASALQGAQEHFDFDLAKPGMALAILDKMTVAGRAGVIEIEDLSGAFASSAANARKAGLTFDQTLALFEGLGTATTKERLGTLVDSTLRLFTNDQYRRAAQKATGVKFYESDGSRRGPLDVIQDIQTAYSKLKTDVERDRFIARAFGKTDMDTQKGLAAALGEGKLGEILAIVQEIEGASGTIQRDLPEAINNAVDATARLKNVLAKAADGFAQPINAAIVKGIDFLSGTGEGQLGLSGGQLIGLGGAGALSLLLTKRMGGRAIGGLLDRLGGTAAGVAQGKALEAAAGVTPVFVTNFAQMGGALGGVPAVVAGAPAGTGRLAKAGRVAGGVGLAGGLGYLIGDTIYEKGLEGTDTGRGLGLYMSRLSAQGNAGDQQTLNDEGTGVGRFRGAIGASMPFVGIIDAMLSSKFQEMREQREMQKLEGVIRVEVTDTGTRVTSARSSSAGVEIQANTGRMMAGGGGR